MQPKPFYKSKTLIINGFLLLVVAAGWIGQNAGALEMDPRVPLLMTGLVLVIGAGLRMVTNTAIQGTPAAATAIQALPLAQPSANASSTRVADLERQRDIINAQLTQVATIAAGKTP